MPDHCSAPPVQGDPLPARTSASGPPTDTAEGAEAGDLGRAIPLYKQALADSVRVLGGNHPQTKIVRGNLTAARQRPQ